MKTLNQHRFLFIRLCLIVSSFIYGGVMALTQPIDTYPYWASLIAFPVGLGAGVFYRGLTAAPVMSEKEIWLASPIRSRSPIREWLFYPPFMHAFFLPLLAASLGATLTILFTEIRLCSDGLSGLALAGGLIVGLRARDYQALEENKGKDNQKSRTRRV